MILVYVTSFLVCQSVCLFFCIVERYKLHIITHSLHLILVGLESYSLVGSSRNGDLKTVKIKEVPKFKGNPKDIFLRVGLNLWKEPEIRGGSWNP